MSDWQGAISINGHHGNLTAVDKCGQYLKEFLMGKTIEKSVIRRM